VIFSLCNVIITALCHHSLFNHMKLSCS
jgi:hypothetical protein